MHGDLSGEALARLEAASRMGTDIYAEHSEGMEIESSRGPLGASIRPYVVYRIQARILAAGELAGSYAWEEVTRTDVEEDWQVVQREGTATGLPLLERNGFSNVPTGTVVEAVLHESGAFYLFSAGFETTFLAQLTSKCYYDGSDTRDPTDNLTPTGEGLNCPPDVDCLKARFIKYGWTKVTDGTSPCALSYTAGADFGTPSCWPAYHVQNIDLPVFPEPSPMTRYPGTVENASGAGSVAWTSPALAATSNDSRASAPLELDEQTQYLKATGFCFNLPGDAVITGITVGIEGYADADSVKDIEVKLVVGGTISGNNLATTTDLPDSESTRTYSTTPSGWGVTVTALDINDAGFGAAVRYRNYNASTRTVYVDAISIAIAFTPAGAIGIHRAIVRLRKGRGEYYLIETMPWVDLFRRTEDTDEYGYIGYHRYWDNNAQEWRDGEEVRIQIVE